MHITLFMRGPVRAASLPCKEHMHADCLVPSMNGMIYHILLLLLYTEGRCSHFAEKDKRKGMNQGDACWRQVSTHDVHAPSARLLMTR